MNMQNVTPSRHSAAAVVHDFDKSTLPSGDSPWHATGSFNKSLRCAAVCAWLISVPVSLPAAPTPEMFAYGMKLDAPEKNAFYELELPLQVYQAVTSKDLDDIRVFNSGGAVVPHVVYRPANQLLQRDAVQADLPFFPIIVPVNGSGAEIAIHIEKDAQGTIIDVKTGNEDHLNLPDQKISSYLIDAGKLKGKPINSLELEWSDQQAEFMGNIHVETSGDLTNWRRIATGTVARLGYGNYRLDRNKIPLPTTGSTYLRLSWPEGQDVLALTKVAALANTTYTVNKPDYNWTRATVTPVPDKPGRYTIDPGGSLPADKIIIRLKDRNSMAAVKLYSGPSEEKNNTTEQWRGLVYHLDYQETAISNSEINIRGIATRYWLLTVDESETTLGTTPEIDFGWQPHRLTFLAQGNPPFQLAYGSTTAPRPDFKVDPLLQKYRQGSGMIKPGKVSPGPQYILAGSARLLPAPPPLPWKKYILWASLFAGVLAIGWMSVTLFRQLQAADKKDDFDNQA